MNVFRIANYGPGSDDIIVLCILTFVAWFVGWVFYKLFAKNTRYRAIYVILVAIFLTPIVMALSNPGLRVHQKEVRKFLITEAFKYSYSSSDVKTINYMINSYGVNEIIDKCVKTQDCGLFSRTIFVIPEISGLCKRYEEVIGFGVFGMVFIDE